MIDVIPIWGGTRRRVPVHSYWLGWKRCVVQRAATSRAYAKMYADQCLTQHQYLTIIRHELANPVNLN